VGLRADAVRVGLMFRAQARLDIADGGICRERALRELVDRGAGTLVIAALMFIIAMGALEGINGPSWTLLNQFARTC